MLTIRALRVHAKLAGDQNDSSEKTLIDLQGDEFAYQAAFCNTPGTDVHVFQKIDQL